VASAGGVLLESDDPISKAERLALASQVAPILRADPSLRSKRVTLTNKEGKITGYSTIGEVQDSLLRRHQIEIDVQPDVRPKETICYVCGKPIKVMKRGHIPTCHPLCSGKVLCACGRLTGRSASYRGSTRCVKCRLSDISISIPNCKDCDKPLTANKGAYRCRECYKKLQINISKRCLDCKKLIGKTSTYERCRVCQKSHIRNNDPECKCADCGKQLSRISMTPAKIKRRNGGPPRCKECSIASLKNKSYQSSVLSDEIKT
jgi:hypothetical protein